MKKPILDPIDYFHPMYGEEAGETLKIPSAPDQEGEDPPLSWLHTYDEDNSFVKLGDFWPKAKRERLHSKLVA